MEHISFLAMGFLFLLSGSLGLSSGGEANVYCQSLGVVTWWRNDGVVMLVRVSGGR